MAGLQRDKAVKQQEEGSCAFLCQRHDFFLTFLLFRNTFAICAVSAVVWLTTRFDSVFNPEVTIYLIQGVRSAGRSSFASKVHFLNLRYGDAELWDIREECFICPFWGKPRN